MHYTVFGFLATAREREGKKSEREGFIRTLGGCAEEKHIRITNKRNSVT